MLVSRVAAEELFGAKGAHQIVVQLERPADADALAARWQQQLGPRFEVLTYAQIVPIFKTLEDFVDSVILVASLFIYLLVGLGILNTMLMSVLERKREFGVLRAIGTRPGRVVGQVLGESFWIATMSAALGLAIGGTLAWYGSHHAFMKIASGEAIEYGGTVLRSGVKTKLVLGDALVATALVYAMALVTALYPAWRVARLAPAEALHVGH